MSKSLDILTFGCRLNAFESEVMRTHAQKAGLDNTILINTCAVTAEAERQARQQIRKLKRDNPDKKIIVTGCSAQINPDSYKEMPEVNHVLGNQDKLNEASYFSLKKEPHSKMHVSDIMAAKEIAPHIVTSLEGLSRAYVQVQNGCDHRCTFCTIPYGRGNSRSVPMGDLFSQVQAYVENGYKEVVLTGVDITSYGHDLPGSPTLGQMMRRLLTHIPDLKRLRLSSVDPVEIDKDVFELLENNPRFMPHLHISLQAGDDLILKRMKRRHLRPDLLNFCERARTARPDVVFGADIIAGFPTEKEEHFQNTFNIIKDCDLTFTHIFPYSPRPGTPAARMPQVERSVIKERAKKLREEADRLQQIHLQKQVGKIHSVLVEDKNMGRADNFMPIKLDGFHTIGDIITVQITAVQGDKLVGTPLP